MAIRLFLSSRMFTCVCVFMAMIAREGNTQKEQQKWAFENPDDKITFFLLFYLHIISCFKHLLFTFVRRIGHCHRRCRCRRHRRCQKSSIDLHMRLWIYVNLLPTCIIYLILVAQSNICILFTFVHNIPFGIYTQKNTFYNSVLFLFFPTDVRLKEHTHTHTHFIWPHATALWVCVCVSVWCFFSRSFLSFYNQNWIWHLNVLLHIGQ